MDAFDYQTSPCELNSRLVQYSDLVCSQNTVGIPNPGMPGFNCQDIHRPRTVSVFNARSDTQIIDFPRIIVCDKLGSLKLIKPFCKTAKMKGLLVGGDARKAFDSVNYSYMQAVKEAYKRQGMKPTTVTPPLKMVLHTRARVCKIL